MLQENRAMQLMLRCVEGVYGHKVRVVTLILITCVSVNDLECLQRYTEHTCTHMHTSVCMYTNIAHVHIKHNIIHTYIIHIIHNVVKCRFDHLSTHQVESNTPSNK